MSDLISNNNSDLIKENSNLISNDNSDLISNNKKHKKHRKNNGWNSANESIVKEIGELSQGYARLNRESGLMRERYDFYLFMFELFLSALTILLSTLNGSGTFEFTEVVSYVVAGVAAIEYIPKGITKYYKYKEKYPVNFSIAKKFQSIAKECSHVLKYKRKDRISNGALFTINIKNKYDSLVYSEDNDIIDKYFIRYYKDYENAGISLPGFVTEININSELDLNDNSSSNDGSITRSNSNSETLTKIINNNSISGKNKMNMFMDNTDKHICIQMNLQ